MAKRYFDTDIWKKRWFRSLSPMYKSSWWYIISQCDHAGFFEPDIDIMSIFVGEELNEKELMEIFSDRIEYLENGKWFIPKFLQFQYKVSHPDELNLSNRVHKSVYDRIKKYDNLFRPLDEASKGHTRVMLGASKEMEGVKDKDKDKDKAISKSSIKIKRKVFEIPSEEMVVAYCKERKNSVNAVKFVNFYISKGWMVGKNKMKDWQAAVRSWEVADKENLSTRSLDSIRGNSRAYIQESDRGGNDDW
tara:strand:- start:1930 stop:2673 length:744 start_codon:yes stop_codon:yes gene_type:complete